MTIEEIGIAVRQARLAQRLRQDQLAAAAGVGLRFLVESSVEAHCASTRCSPS